MKKLGIVFFHIFILQFFIFSAVQTAGVTNIGYTSATSGGYFGCWVTLENQATLPTGTTATHSGLINNKYVFADMNIAKDTQYTYRFVAIDSSGNILGISNLDTVTT